MSLPTFEKMLQARTHIGHRASKWNPRFAPFILTKKNERHIIDLAKTHECLQIAAKNMQEIIKKGGKILFVGTKKQAQAAIIDATEKLEAPYIIERWLGGTLTNFPTIYKSIKKLSKMDELEDDPAYKHLTKKEQAIIQGKRITLEKNLAGIKGINRLPQALFVIDIKREATAVKEATKLGIPIFAIVDSNTNPTLVDFPIPCNDDSKAAIEIILQYLALTVAPSLQAFKEAKNAPAQFTTQQNDAAATPTNQTTDSAKKTTITKEPVKTAEPAEKAKPAKTAATPTTAKETTKTDQKMDKQARLMALKTLRERTKAGVMACQKALKEANGDIEQAVKILHVEIKKKVEKLRKNEATHNVVFGNVNDKQNLGVLIQLACQTDFVGSNPNFAELANEIIHTALEQNPEDATKLLAAKTPTGTVQEKIDFWIAAFGENIVLVNYQSLKGEAVTCYVHSGKKGSLVATNKTEAVQKADNPAKKLAMQVVLNKPLGITLEEATKQLEATGKKIPNIEKAAASKALLTQPFFQKEDQTVSDYIKEIDPTLTVKGFISIPPLGKKTDKE